MDKSELDVAALETVSFAKNYNNYVFNLILARINGERIADFGAGYGNFCLFLKSKKKFTIPERNAGSIHGLSLMYVCSQLNVNNALYNCGTLS